MKRAVSLSITNTRGRFSIALFCFIIVMDTLRPTMAAAKRSPFQQEALNNFDPPPYMALAEQAIVEGDMDVAVRVLRSAQACWSERFEQCGFTRVDYDSLAGVVYLERGLTEKAERALESVVAAQPNRAMAWFYLGQTYLMRSKHKEAADALVEAVSVGRKLPQYHAMLVRAWMGAEEQEKARQALQTGLVLFPNDAPLLFEGVNLFLSQGLLLTATDLARRHALAVEKNKDLALLVVAETLRKKGWLRDAIRVLEEARLICGETSDAAVRLAYVYAEAGEHSVAARIFDRLTGKRSALAFAASEQYRLAEHYLDALRVGALIVEDNRRTEQLATIYLQMDAFDTAVEKLHTLAENGELREQGKYRLAYAAMRAGSLDMAGRILKTIQDPALRIPAEQLRMVMKKCREMPWYCW